MDAQAHQVRRARREQETADTPITQLPPISMPPLGEELDIAPDIIKAEAEVLHKHDSLAALAFGEEAIAIIIQPSGERNAQIVHDAWVNGKGAEVFVNGKWFEYGCIPVGIEVITKRKYAEVLARKKTTNITTQEIRHDDHEENNLIRHTSHGCPFSVIEDRNPRGRQWLSDLLRAAA